MKLLFRGTGGGVEPSRKYFVILRASFNFFVIFSYRFESLNSGRLIPFDYFGKGGHSNRFSTEKRIDFSD